MACGERLLTMDAVPSAYAAVYRFTSPMVGRRSSGPNLCSVEPANGRRGS